MQQRFWQYFCLLDWWSYFLIKLVLFVKVFTLIGHNSGFLVLLFAIVDLVFIIVTMENSFGFTSECTCFTRVAVKNRLVKQALVAK
jgi:hypothetical protein